MSEDFNGYPNSATFCAALYLSNDPRAHKHVADMFMRNNNLSCKDAKSLFSILGLELDSWVEGPVDWDLVFEELVEPIREELAEKANTPMPNDVLAVLSQCTIEGFTVKLPCQLPRDLYVKVAAILKELDGPWNKKAGGHVFKEDPSGLIDDIIVTGKYKKPEKYGYFPTPTALAEDVVRKARLLPGMTVLEPSAGSANLADIIAQIVPQQDVTCCELQAKNVEILREKGYRVAPGDFLSVPTGEYYFDRVVMNPPFERQADVAHVLHAWNFVKPGGRLVSIMSAGVLFRQDRKATEFRDFVELHAGEITENPEGSFKSSGTSVNTITLVIDKPAADYPCNDDSWGLVDFPLMPTITEPAPAVEPLVTMVAEAIKAPVPEQPVQYGFDF